MLGRDFRKEAAQHWPGRAGEEGDESRFLPTLVRPSQRVMIPMRPSESVTALCAEALMAPVSSPILPFSAAVTTEMAMSRTQMKLMRELWAGRPANANF